MHKEDGLNEEIDNYLGFNKEEKDKKYPKKVEVKCGWCGSFENVGYVGNKEGRAFQCSSCLSEELDEEKKKRLINCPIEKSLIERGYEKLKNHSIMPCLSKNGEFYDSDLAFDDAEANLFLVFQHHDGKEIEFSSLEEAFLHCMKTEKIEIEKL